MQYTVAQIPRGLDLALVAEVLTSFDPAAVVDVDDNASGRTLRFSTFLGTAAIVRLLKAVGIPVGRASGERVASQRANDDAH